MRPSVVGPSVVGVGRRASGLGVHPPRAQLSNHSMGTGPLNSGITRCVRVHRSHAVCARHGPVLAQFRCIPKRDSRGSARRAPSLRDGDSAEEVCAGSICA